jgi:nucleotide-binding universal stress UspA family protein
MSDSNRNIVVAVRDSSYGRRALHRALSLARPGKDSIHLVHARRLVDLTRVAELLVPRWINADVEEPDDDAWLEALAVEARNKGHLAQGVRLSGTPGTAVADYAGEIGAHLIVVACPRETLARKLFLGSTALRILRTASCPVLVARNDPAQVYASALVAIDGTNMSRRVLAAAGACFPEVRVDLLHAYRVPGEHKVRMAGASEQSIAEVRSARRLDLARDLQTLAAELPQAVTHVEHGFPESVILELCNRLKPDVLVIGKHSGSALDEHVIGSVTQFLLYTCDTDFLLVP